jgi:chloramphenicol 3-O phosphotransferase
MGWCMKKIIGIIIVGIVGIIGWCMYNKKSNQPTGIVIVLNGPSAAGKSSIQKEFQNLMMPNLWIRLGIDQLFDSPLPEIKPENLSFWQSKNPIRWVETATDTQGNSLVTLFVGNQGEKVVYGMNSAIAEYAKNGCNIIVDYIAYDGAWLKDLEHKLKHIPTIYVKVEIPLEVLEQREKNRATSPVGHARSHYDFVYGNHSYDLVVNSEKQSAHEIAKQIKQYIETSKALKGLYSTPQPFLRNK